MTGVKAAAFALGFLVGTAAAVVAQVGGALLGAALHERNLAKS